MTGFFEEVGKIFASVGTTHRRFVFFLSSLVSLRRCGACSVRVDTNQIVKKAAGMNLAERFLRGVICELLKRSPARILSSRFVPLTRRRPSDWKSRRDIRGLAGFATWTYERRYSVLHMLSSETFKETIEFALDAFDAGGVDFVLRGNRNRESPQRFPALVLNPSAS